MAPVAVRPQIVFPEPLHEVPGEAVTFRILRVALEAGVPMVSHRVDERLGTDRRTIQVSRFQAHDCAEVAASAIARDGNLAAIRPKVRSILLQPFQGGVAIVHRCGKPVFWRQTVIHQHHNALGGIGEAATVRVVGVQPANHPSATMKVQCGGDALVRTKFTGPINANGDFATWTGNLAILHFENVYRVAVQCREVPCQLTDLFHRQQVWRSRASFGKAVQDQQCIAA